MKYITLFIISILIISGCSTENKKPSQLKIKGEDQSYSFNTGDNFEVTSTIILQGFKNEKSETEKKYKISIDYSIDLIKPDGSTEENIRALVKNDMPFTEPQNEFAIDATLSLPVQKYPVGEYKLKFNITDNLSGDKLSHTTKPIKFE